MKKQLFIALLTAFTAGAASVSYQSMTNYVTNYVTVELAPIRAYQSSTSNSVVVTNLALYNVQWTGMLVNYAFSTIGPSAPALTPVTNGSPVQALAFDNGDILYAQCQFPHNLAVTNSRFPNFYFEPHIHFSTAGTLDATHSNVTWRIEWEIARINGAYTNRGTNTATMGVTNNFTHRALSMGTITNNNLGISSIFRCRLMRPASAAQDYSNAHDVILDGIDLHVPVGNLTGFGSRDIHSQ